MAGLLITHQPAEVHHAGVAVSYQAVHDPLKQGNVGPVLPPGLRRRGRRPDPLPGAARLAGHLPCPNGRRYPVEACEGHRPPKAG
jgi:hypothetical protein